MGTIKSCNNENHNEKYLKSFIPKTEKLLQFVGDTTAPYFRGNYIVYYLSKIPTNGLDGIRLHEIAELEGFYFDKYNWPSGLYDDPRLKTKFWGLAFDPFRKGLSKDIKNYTVENVAIIAVVLPFIAKHVSSSGTYITIYKDPLTGEELSRTDQYEKEFSFAYYGVNMWLIDVRNRSIIYKKIFREDDDHGDPIVSVYMFLRDHCVAENVK